ncbi:lysophospholipid acyltransferase family protein [Sinisalibacter aestuarii]|uniref:1-acyl-sn-glycerol-3-phosphate acyltransferase n=1 Tax=Sinisalibacter aestuarii TaxID=2949426 RepID=A0ABQ5LT55_9RHOB|nr:1-acyl-sn-glycerol-3-phosphate acyltransferase [Sinisalibacter aestuarii]GKY87928.1 1-acyl-sn-glycerol-3-phosphate acyltransferase [Sinisalibacter aestuarii]
MSVVWNDGSTPEQVRITPLGWLRAVLRGVLILVVILSGLVLMLFLRLIEKPVFGVNRPVTPWITQAVCTLTLRILGLKLRLSGEQMTRRKGAVVANHASWLDIFVLNARKRVYFVAKAEVAGWPGVSWLAKATGTVFINRDRREAGAQVRLFRERLGAGHKLLFFPEGTSTDSRRVLPFKTTLFAAFFDEGLRSFMHIQPVTVLYRAPAGRDARFYGWWGSQPMGPHLLKVLAEARNGEVELVYHEPVQVSEFEDRKALAAYCERVVRDPLDLELAKAAE